MGFLKLLMRRYGGTPALFFPDALMHAQKVVIVAQAGAAHGYNTLVRLLVLGPRDHDQGMTIFLEKIKAGKTFWPQSCLPPH